MVEYDPQIIEEFAERLYRRASAIVIWCTLLGALIGGALGQGMLRAIVLSVAPDRDPDVAAAAIGALVGAAIGYAIGQARAFWLRLRAQQTLCQLQIERNTRAATKHEVTEAVHGMPPIYGVGLGRAAQLTDVDAQ